MHVGVCVCVRERESVCVWEGWRERENVKFGTLQRFFFKCHFFLSFNLNSNQLRGIGVLVFFRLETSSASGIGADMTGFEPTVSGCRLTNHAAKVSRRSVNQDYNDVRRQPLDFVWF